MTTDAKSEAESLIPLFRFRQLLNQDQSGRRISLLGDIHEQPALLTLERAAFPTDPSIISSLLSRIGGITNLGSNDIYRWYLAMASSSSSSSSSSEPPSSSSSSKISDDSENSSKQHNLQSIVVPVRAPPDLKLNLIYPCTDQHIKKYSPQSLRMVTETPEIYATYVLPFMQRKREEGRLNWVFNIIEGRTEQEDVILREYSTSGDRSQTTTAATSDSEAIAAAEEKDEADEAEGANEGFLLLPDLNWDRETVGSLHLLALVERRDIWSLRDLKKRHVGWLKNVREKILSAAVGIYGPSKGVESDMLKLYVHCEFFCCSSSD